MLRVGGVLETSLLKDRIDLEPDILHQIVNIVAMILPQLNLVSLVQLDSLAQLASLCLLYQPLLVSLDLRPCLIVLHGLVQSALLLSHFFRSLRQQFCSLGETGLLFLLPSLYFGCVGFDFFSLLSKCLNVPLGLLFKFFLPLRISLLLELGGLTFDLPSSLLCFEVFDHVGLLGSQFLFALNLLDHVHFALVLIP